MAKKKITLRIPEPSVSPRFQKELNPEQLQAVLHKSGPAIVIAGAGSGKTRMLTYRVAYLIQNNTPASAIILVTFTKKAAQEMLARVQGLVGSEIKGLKAGTFHHLANMTLRRYGKLLKIDPNFTIMDPGDQKHFMKYILGQRFDPEERRRFPKPTQILGMHSKTINLGIPLSKVLSEYYPAFLDQIVDITDTLSVFTKQKKVNNTMDFDDLLVNFLKFIRNKKVAAKYLECIRHVLVDEYQDMNAIQAEIVELLGKNAKSITIVGDDAQAIYKFRGGDFQHMLNFPKIFPNCQTYKLETNYRSTPEILKLANASIAKNHVGFKKELRTTRKSGNLPMMIPCTDLYQEAQLICQQVLQHRDEGIPLNEQAVLFRAHYHTMNLEQELVRQNIPYIMRAGVRFFEQAHIKDLVSYLAVMVNPTDRIQWIRILSMHEGVSDSGAGKIITTISKQTQVLTNFVYCNLAREMQGKRLRKAGLENLKQLQQFFRKLAFQSGTKQRYTEDQLPNLPQMIEKVTQYLKPMFPTRYPKNYEDRLRDLRELMNFGAKYNTITAFLADILTQYNLQGETIEDGDRTIEEAPLVLSTIHQAKGLEWKVVYIISLLDGRLPSARAIGDEAEIEEERRLFYVACTRAKDVLYLTYPEIVQRFDRDQISGPSRFLEEIEKEKVFEEV
ncbi:MAG: ATP-dependent helicase, partial [Promethearchaeota archaeon]